jgi:cell division protein ZapA (FtsZ GTPase activity inhibitor)
MAETHRVEVEILGQRYAIRSEAPPEHVHRLAAYLQGRLRELRGAGAGSDPVKLLTLAALDITDELFRAREDQSRDDGDATARVRALLHLLDSAIAEPSRSPSP